MSVVEHLNKKFFRTAKALLLSSAIVLIITGAYSAQASTTSASDASISSAIFDYLTDWPQRVARIQSEQPHWLTPIVTVTPCLEEKFRYDQLWLANPHGSATDNFDGGKGLELIPLENIGIILGVPAWQAHNGHIRPATKGKSSATDGWADETFLFKYRLFSRNEKNGDYIVTAFMGFSAPTGDDGNSNHHGVFTPTIAIGKGFGYFDFQSTGGISLPDGGLQRLGMPVAWNTAFQYQIFRFFWPEFEINYTWWPNGQREGQNQVFLTPGLVVGRIPLYERIRLTVGFGYQVAVTDHAAYHHSAILTERISF